MGLIKSALKKLLATFLFFCTDRELGMLRFELTSYVKRRTTGPLVFLPDQTNYIDLGSGSVRHPGFTSIDFFNVPNVHYAADLRYPLRIGNDTTNGIFTEHVFEHLTYAEVDRMLAECYRVLKPGGSIRIIVPDISIFAKNYAAGNSAWFDEWENMMFKNSTDAERAQRRLVTPMSAISFVTQEYGHVSCWDFDTMAHYLARNGFVQIRQSAYRDSLDPMLAIDLDAPDRRYVSLFVDACKPSK